MPAWIHDRADHIRAKNPGMAKSTSFALATQQAYAAGKAPSNYGTSEGRSKAHKKYDAPKSHYKKSPAPESKTKKAGFSLAVISGFVDEAVKIAAAASAMTATSTSQVVKPMASSVGKPKLPKLTSAPQPAPETAPVQDHIGSMKANPPPPVKM